MGVSLPRSAAGKVRRKLSRGPPQYPEGALVLEVPWEDTEEGGYIPFCVGYLLKSGGPGISDLGFRNIGALSGNF